MKKNYLRMLQDNAKPHTSAAEGDYLKKEGVKVELTPPTSSDL